jgi:hypothetical protein
MTSRDPLSAVPVAALHTSLLELPTGGAVLTRCAPAAAGLRAGLARALRFRHQQRFELDEVGAYFWCQVDGERRLSDIHGSLCRRYGLSSNEARRAIVEFTAVLLRRNLLALRLEDT